MRNWVDALLRTLWIPKDFSLNMDVRYFIFSIGFEDSYKSY